MKLLGFPLAKAEDITQTILVNLGLNLAEKKYRYRYPVIV